MYQIDFKKPMHIHFIGIGGISMSGLASILLKQHFKVSGSDAHESELTKQLEAEGAILYYGQRASNLDDTPDLVVYTAAIHPDNPEYAAAVAKQIPMLSRAELLGQMMHNFKTPVAISGTHGKTTTTSMASYIFLEADMDPTISVGGILDAIGGNIRVGGHDTFLTEACEYTNSFLHFFPKISVILNIDADHLDFFKDLDDIRHSFRKFAQLLPDDGTLIVNSEIEHLDQLTEGLTCKIVTYGMDASSDYYASNITFDEFAHPSFDCYKGDTLLGHFVLHVPGIHNVSNALASIALADQMGVSMEQIKDMVDVNTVIGDAVQTQDGSTIIPISRVSFGFVAGGGEYAVSGAQAGAYGLPFAGGAGAGVSIHPMGFLVCGRNGVRLLSAGSASPMERVAELIPQALENWKRLGDEQENAKPSPVRAAYQE